MKWNSRLSLFIFLYFLILVCILKKESSMKSKNEKFLNSINKIIRINEKIQDVNI